MSLASGRSVVESLDPERYEVQEIEIGRDGAWELGSTGGTRGRGRCRGGRRQDRTCRFPIEAGSPEPLGDVDVVFPVLHGPFGEDGTVQGLLELAGVAYVGAGVTASALCMDKDLFKAVLRDKGIPVVRSVTALKRHADRVENPFGYPVVVKPARLGSSVGISIVHEPDELAAAVELAFEHDEKILLEEFVRGSRGRVRRARERRADRLAGRRDRDALERLVRLRRQVRRGRHGAGRPGPNHARRRRGACRSSPSPPFVAADCEGMARVDFFVREDGEVLVNELNTIPGFTATSVYAKLFEASGIPYAELLDRLVDLALERRDRRAGLEF